MEKEKDEGIAVKTDMKYKVASHTKRTSSYLELTFTRSDGVGSTVKYMPAKVLAHSGSAEVRLFMKEAKDSIVDIPKYVIVKKPVITTRRRSASEELIRNVKVLKGLGEYGLLFKHSSIVRTVESYHPGETLEQFASNHELTVLEKLKMLLIICQELQVLQLQGKVHEDVKAENIIVENIKHDRILPRLIDFGRACDIGERTPCFAKKSFYDRIYYAPELVLADGEMKKEVPADTSHDVYSFAFMVKWLPCKKRTKLSKVVSCESLIDSSKYSAKPSSVSMETLCKKEKSKIMAPILSEVSVEPTKHKKMRPFFYKEKKLGDFVKDGRIIAREPFSWLDDIRMEAPKVYYILLECLDEAPEKRHSLEEIIDCLRLHIKGLAKDLEQQAEAESAGALSV